jgi:hypothetical protein
MEPQFVTIPLSEYQQLLEGIQEISRLRDDVDKELERLALDLADDRRRLTRLETPPAPTPSQKDRADILRALLAASGSKLLVSEARKKMHLSKSQFSQLLASMDSDIELKPYHLDKRQKILQLK